METASLCHKTLSAVRTRFWQACMRPIILHASLEQVSQLPKRVPGLHPGSSTWLRTKLGCAPTSPVSAHLGELMPACWIQPGKSSTGRGEKTLQATWYRFNGCGSAWDLNSMQVCIDWWSRIWCTSCSLLNWLHEVWDVLNPMPGYLFSNLLHVVQDIHKLVLTVLHAACDGIHVC